MIIYKITNIINNKIYIGQTTSNIKKRWGQHKASSRNKKSKLYNAMRKYGVENFKIEEIVKAESIEELNELEEKIINENNSVQNGYNIIFGGKNYTRIHKNGLNSQQEKLVKTIKKSPIILQCMILWGMLMKECKRYIENNPDDKRNNNNNQEINEMTNNYIYKLKTSRDFVYIRHHLLNILEIIVKCNEIN